MARFGKPLRVAVSILVLLATAFIFLNFRQNTDTVWYRVVTFLQFTPSLRKFLIVPGLLAAGFIIVTVITLVCGRVYCSFVCPLGVLQDVTGFVSKRLRGRKKSRHKFVKPNNILRYSFLAIAIVPVILSGSVITAGLLDPYSNFGRILSGLGQPVFIALNNIIARLLIRMNVYSLSPEDTITIQFEALIYPLAILALLIFLTWKRGRIYCNTVCPVGTFLGLLSRVSLFRIRIDDNACTKCANCSVACKAQCIDLKSMKIDASRCVGCFNCIGVCDNKGIKYRFNRPLEAKARSARLTLRPPVEKHVKAVISSRYDGSPALITKRQFLTDSALLTGAILGIAGTAAAQQGRMRRLHGEGAHILTPVEKTNHCSPPGSVSLRHFNNACTACHLCVSACINKVLRPSLLQYGLQGFLQPYMDTEHAYCNYECTICGEVCPTGAILPLTVEEKKVTQPGVVRFIRHNCVVFTDETVCGACSEHCPTKAVTMIPYAPRRRRGRSSGSQIEQHGNLTIPEIHPDICVGCGACEQACPVVPHKAIYVDGHATHKIADKPVIKKQEDSALEEFPF